MYSKALPILKILGASLMAWKIICVFAGTAYPLMIVSSESIEPSLHREDLIFLDIPVIWFNTRPLPIVHRAIQVIEQEVKGVSQSEQLILTKGDNNTVNNTGIYSEGQHFVYREDIVGLISLWLKKTPFILYIVTVTLIIVGAAS
ncbi:uncharacterized protein BO87DRAFT_399745 [Aspergillus neoniger CBS 115656]|uniref:Signal peptidase complex catalytic subunit SEC11 n=1 Tax=Aspergillus neoniger (strain CBS 115656) TaxID=1448310 RepID=A0A318YCM0_ASPNB|nr:hypothetical protein BO87DRAFT_399745 [Aspergillus neoniger CBS 115656]PYH31317.1 hypothetical protein BO87DRAFT_399745 [Aspergillus neoniger CBS 115656]